MFLYIYNVMKRNHFYTSQLVKKYLRNQLSEQEAIDFRDWLASDHKNKDLVENFKNANAIEEDLNFMHDVDVDAAWDKVNVKQGKKRKPNYYKYTAVAALVAMCFSLTWIWLNQQSDTVAHKSIVADTSGKYKNDVLPGTSGAHLILADGSHVDVSDTKTISKDAKVEGSKDGIRYVDQGATKALVYNTLVVPKASFFKIELSDGTKVWVNAVSKLKFPVQFSGNERRVYLEGEAYFEVAKDASRPFVVEAGGNSIKVLGTHFNVNSYSKAVKTTLVEGKVEVSNGEMSALLLPGESALSTDQSVKKSKSDFRKELAWKNNEFYFKGDNIASIAAELSRWYDLDVSFIGQIEFDKGYSGSIERNVNLSQVLEMLRYVSHLDFDVDGKKLTIINKHINRKTMEK